MVSSELKVIFEFGPFRVDTREKLLSRDGTPIPLTPKVFELLLALVENRGRTLTTNDLMERVWADSYVEVGNLNRNVSTLRSVLGESSHNPHFIKTLPKRGYRFEADVREVLEYSDIPVVETHVRSNVSSKHFNSVNPASDFDSRRLVIILGVALGVIVLALVLAYSTRDSKVQSNKSAVSENAEALELYNRGRALWQNRSGESLHQATLLLEQAVDKDPNLALAHAALADAYVFDIKNRAKAEETAKRAIALDPNIGEPHATLGFLKMFWDWKLIESQEHFKTAVTLSPNYATAHQWYAINLAVTGQGNAALAEMRTALDLAPDSLPINADMCQVLYFTQRFDEAEMQCKNVLELNPRFLNANLYLYDVYTAKGMYDEAVAQFFKIEAIAPNYAAFPRDVAELKDAYASGGIRAFWQKRIEMLEKLPSMNYAIAVYHARLGDNDKALAQLKTAHEKHDLNFLYFLSEPLFLNCCYSDPRYQELQQSMAGHKGRGY